jgi:hypothetical protein
MTTHTNALEQERSDAAASDVHDVSIGGTRIAPRAYCLTCFWESGALASLADAGAARAAHIRRTQEAR